MAGRRKLKVVFLASCVRGGGAGWSLYYLLKYLDRERIEPLLVLPAQGIFAQRYAELGLEVVTPTHFPETHTSLRFARNNRITFVLSAVLNTLEQLALIPRLARLFRRRGIDLVYCNNMRMHEFGAPAAQLAGVPCVLHARNLYDSPARNAMYRWISYLPAVRRVIANSSATAAPYRGSVSRKLSVVHNGIDLAEYVQGDMPQGQLRAELGLGPDVTIVGFTGRIEPKKGLAVLIRAAATVLQRRPQVVFVALGSVPLGSPADYRAEYEALARELGIADRFIFAGFRKDVRPALLDFDVFCLPSFREPFGRSIIEAMAMGRPVVACRAGGVPEIITDGVDGVLVPPRDVDALANALASLIDDPAWRARLGEAALQCIRERFDVALLTRQIENTLVEAAETGRQ